MQKIFFRIERFPFQRSSLFGIFTVLFLYLLNMLNLKNLTLIATEI